VITASINGSSDIRADLIKYLGPIVGTQNVAKTYDAAVDELRKQAVAAVKPMAIGVLAATAVAASLGIAAIIISVTR